MGAESGESAFFYFDPKTLALVTGWKTVPAMVTDLGGNVVFEGRNIVTSNAAKKMYFRTSAENNSLKGSLVRNQLYTIKGKSYKFGANGELCSGKAQKANISDLDYSAPECYVKADGSMAVGRTEVKIGGKSTYYYYSPRTYKLEKDVLRKTGSKWYYYGTDGQVSTGFFGLDCGGIDNVYATYNKDGSIKGLFYLDGGGKVTDTLVGIGGTYELYFVGKKGLPETGICTVPLVGGYSVDLKGRKAYVENDGCFNRYVDYSGKYLLKKIGNKIYVLQDGYIQTDPNTLYPIDTATESAWTLSSSDRENIDSYISYMNMMYNYDLRVAVMPDGSLGARTFSDGTVTYHTNRYGMPTERMSPFIKKNGSWYFNKDNILDDDGNKIPDGPGSEIFRASLMTADMRSGLKICWDANYKITSMTLIDDNGQESVPTGVYDITFKVPGVYEGSFTVNMNKGKFVTGKRALKVGNYSYYYMYDPELAVARGIYGGI